MGSGFFSFSPVNVSGGSLNLRSSDGANRFTPGSLVDNVLLGQQNSLFRLSMGKDSDVRAIFRADFPKPGQAYGLQLFTFGTNELVNVAVSNCGSDACVAALHTGPPVATTSLPVNLAASKQITLRLLYASSTNRVTASFSHDGMTFTEVPLPPSAKVLTSGDEAIVSLFGSMFFPPSGSLDDTFDDDFLDPGRWTPFVNPRSSSAIVSELNQRLEVTLPAGATNAGLTSRCALAGNFDVQADFRLLTWPKNNLQVVRLAAADLGSGASGLVGVERFSGNVESYHMIDIGSTIGFFQTTGLSSKLRLVRSGSNMTGFFHNGVTFVQAGTISVPIGPTRFVFNVGSNNPSATAAMVALDNFHVTSGIVQCQ